MTRIVLSQVAEDSIRRVMTTLSFSKESFTRASEERGRLRGTVGVDRSDPSFYMTLPHVVAIAEEYSHQALILVSAALIDLDHPFRKALWRQAEDTAEGAWEGHIAAWKKWHDIQLGQCPQFAALRVFVQARNAVMHGLGQLTRRQLRDGGGAPLIRNLGSVDIATIGTRLVISQSSVERCAGAAREYIAWLDARVASRFPSEGT